LDIDFNDMNTSLPNKRKMNPLTRLPLIVFLIGILLLFSNESHAQKKCKYFKYKIDVYTNKLEVITKSDKVQTFKTYDYAELFIHFERIQSTDTTLYFLVAEYRDVKPESNWNIEINQDTHLFISLKNMDIIELTPEPTRPVVSPFIDDKTKSEYITKITYPVTLDQLRKLQVKDFGLARLYYREKPTNRKEYINFDDLDVFKKPDFLKEQIRCLLM